MMARILLICLLLGTWLFAQGARAKEQPNIILIYADDLGAGILGCYGQKIIKTPHIDRLAAEGMRFTNAHGCRYCAPARASLLTGLHDAHRGAWSITLGGLIVRQDQGGLKQAEVKRNLRRAIQAADQEVFLGQVAQKAGYQTSQFGKLGWGFTTTDARLTRHGWDHYLGFRDHQRAHGFYPTYLWLNNKKLPLPGNTHLNAGKTLEKYGPGMTAKRRDKTGKATYSQNVLIEHILTYIDNHQDHPFFLYHPTQLPHGPVDIPEVHPDFVNDDRLTDVEKEYASMIKMLDDHVGRIVAKLKELKIDRKTLIIFSADNGHESYYHENKTPLRKRSSHGETDVFRGTMGLAGTKWTNWQGGIRVPLIVRWPERIEAGSTSDRLTAAYDYLPTVADLVGGVTPAGKDGVSLMPTLLGKPTPPRPYIIVGNAVIAGDWKLVDQKFLFNLKEDPGERHNLFTEMTEKRTQLQKILAKEKNSRRRDL